MVAGVPERVVVIGASASGLLAAAALAAPGREITVLERDDDTGGRVVPRQGVPQSRQPHVFLHRGLLEAEKLLPGLREDLVRRGGLPFDTATLPWRTDQGWLPTDGQAYEVVSASRPLLDDVLRSRVVRLPGVVLRSGVRAEGVVRAPNGGWQLRVRDGLVDADLVVDATGRASRLPVWLRDLGVGEARTDELDARLGYATRVFAGGTNVLDAPGVAVLATPANPVGGIALQVEDGRWLVTAVGFGDHRPPRDAEGFDTFLRSLPDPALAELVARCTPLGDVVIHRQTANRRHRYDRLSGWPDGLLAVGDAFCTFNPIYGQGITVAACEAVLLREALTSAAAAGGVQPGWCRTLLSRFASVVDLPWAVATGEDRRFLPGGSRRSDPRRLLGAWTRILNNLAVHGNRRAALQLASVYHLMGSPLGLFHPALVVSALRAAALGYGPPAPRPASLEALSA